ncbi:MAG: YecH family metal-binding protein [Phycisphaeraceae bacterium JB051]
MSCQQQVHGHEVMQMIADANEPITESQLKEQIEAIYGPNPTFFACAIQDVDLQGILTFLKARGKVVETDGKLTTDIGLKCDHG